MLTNTWFNQLHQSLLTSKHRQLLVLSGCDHWCWQQVDTLKTVYPDLLTLSNSLLVNFWPEHNHQLLGQEYSTVVFDVNSGLMPDKLATVAGTVKAGGLLVLLMPNFESYAKQADPAFARFQSANKPPSPISLFQTRFISLLKNNEQALIVAEHHALPTIPIFTATENTQYQEQQNLVADLSKFITKRRAAFLLTADRGRGKSATLGMLAANCSSQGKRIAICAHHKQTVATVFKHYDQLIDNDVKLDFIAPDALLNQATNYDLVLIDEAATLPVSLLKKALDLPIKLGFATTLHGYEGTGRGFNLRFIPYLKVTRSNCFVAELSDPIRYADNDPLENTINQLLVLDADFKQLTINHKNDVTFHAITQQQLANDNELLKQIFAILVMAHYQTSVNDLRHMLDGNNLKVFVAEQNGIFLAAALVALEGELTDPLASQIIAGERRPQGNMLAQSTACLLGEQHLLAARYARIVRIAVNPYCQGDNIGTQLLNTIEKTLSPDVDFIGASFGAEAKLCNFWFKQNYHIIKLGAKQDKASGEHSCLVIKASNIYLDQQTLLKSHFKQQFLFELARSFSHLPSELVLGISANLISSNQQYTSSNNLVKRFSEGQISVDQARFALAQQVYVNPCLLDKLESISRKLIIKLVLQNMPETKVTEALALTGKKQLNSALKQAAYEWCNHYPIL
ncbi:tRNA(Met) cytidine acetyltransferase TmcA [Pseudoalteromonas sp. P1-9]|uniref:GNAT family N-acetyltransferase n=1 Tax=Pseudoalteromonas sp. P1-9 TaxID=1710354 RepID=UPI0006D63370|nr:GNAT family N-acetyltransferase [Pseudoalteromonas sp. P1-9]KPV93825.1 tRNA(Met) cytidine acetyltransferase TmcA [Pseudoalteromonas sp. P1-9]